MAKVSFRVERNDDRKYVFVRRLTIARTQVLGPPPRGEDPEKGFRGYFTDGGLEVYNNQPFYLPS